MNISHLQMLLENNHNACFFTERETGVVLCCNERFISLLEGKQDVTGEIYAQIATPDKVQIEGKLPDWNKETSYHSRIFSKRLNTNFEVRAALLENGTVIFH